MDGHVVGRVYSFRDVTDRKLLEDELAYRASHDALTRLANKSLFQDRLQHALTRRVRGSADSHLAVLFLDLDDFKTVNDSLGHGEGDQLLRRVATTLHDMLRSSDTAARLGGDEFAVLIEDAASHDDVTDLAERILDSLRVPVRLGTKTVSAACSIGIAFYERGGHHQRAAAAQRGHRHVPGEETGEGPFRGLPPRNAHPGPGRASSWKPS